MSSSSTSSSLLRIDVELVERENWVRLVSRVLPVGCVALRRHFVTVWKERTASEWANSPADISRFSTRFAGADATVHVLGAETTPHQRASFARGMCSCGTNPCCAALCKSCARQRRAPGTVCARCAMISCTTRCVVCRALYLPRSLTGVRRPSDSSMHNFR